MSEVQERQRQIIEEFSELRGWESKYKKIIDLGKSLESLPDEEKSEDLKVKGCQSQVWLKATIDDHHNVTYRADSDALIVKGLVTLLLQIYSGLKPNEILETEPSFIAEIGLDSHLSPSRTNGLAAMIRQMKYYAAAFKALQRS